jgi:hypothetical protein
VPEEGGYGLEAHASVDHSGGQRVTQLMGVDMTDAGPFGHPLDVAMDRASVERLAVVAFNEAP